MMRIVSGGLDDARVIALLRFHIDSASAHTAPGSSHALDLSGLKGPHIRFWSQWDDKDLVGMGALKTLAADHGEVKSHTVATHRGKGAGRAMLDHIITEARAAGMKRLSLETGSWDYFLPAHALYRSLGFVECPPFGDYRLDPNSVFMTADLTTPPPHPGA